MKKIAVILLALASFADADAQLLKPGFDVSEFEECICVSSHFKELPGLDSKYFSPEPKMYRRLYTSPVVGFDNVWELWQAPNGVAMINLRASVTTMKSWLSNFHAGQVKAQGTYTLGKAYEYSLCDNSEARVHAGWLGSMLSMYDDILAHIDSCYKAGVKDFIIAGHSQGGTLCYLLTANLLHDKVNGKIPSDITFKTYCSGASKPGDYAFACEYEYMTRGGWAFNVVNPEDWVPETPLSEQQMSDFNATNPFNRLDQMGQLLDTVSAVDRFKAKMLFKILRRPLARSERKLRKYLGKKVGKMLVDEQPAYVLPEFEKCANYVRCGQTVILKPDAEYLKRHPHNADDMFEHHMYKSYYELIRAYKE